VQASDCHRHEFNADFADCLMLTGCRARGLDLYTFDKRLSTLDGARRVLPEP
jgi:predicted nucleic acid-binding protein